MTDKNKLAIANSQGIALDMVCNGWKQPIPVLCTLLTNGNKFAATVFKELLSRAANADKTVYVGDVPVFLKRGQCVCGKYELAKCFGLKRNEANRIHRILKKLEKVNHLVNKQKHQNCSIVTIKNYDRLVRFEQPSELSVNHRRTIGEPSTNTNKSIKSKENVNTVGITKLINHFNTSFGRDYKVTAGRVDKYRARRKTFTQEQLIEAVTKLAKSEFHSGGNDKGWVASPDYLLRNDEIVDSALNMKPPKKKATHKNLAELKYKQFFGGTK